VSELGVVQGRAVSALDLELIRQWVAQNPGWSRWRLSRELAATHQELAHQAQLLAEARADRRTETAVVRPHGRQA